MERQTVIPDVKFEMCVWGGGDVGDKLDTWCELYSSMSNFPIRNCHNAGLSSLLLAPESRVKTSGCYKNPLFIAENSSNSTERQNAQKQYYRYASTGSGRPLNQDD